MRYKILVTPRSFGEGSPRPLQVLEQAGCEVARNTRGRQLTEEELLQAVADVDGIIVGLDPVTRRVIEAGRGLRVISKHGVGTDNIDLDAAAERGIVVTNTPGVNSHAVADLAVGLMLSIARQIPRNADIAARRGKKGIMGRELHGKRLGIVGFGRIGREVARRARGFAMDILYADEARQQPAEAELAARLVPLEELLRRSDVVSLHLPLLPATTNMFSDALLQLMQPLAYLVNTSRAELVDEQALARMLREGRLAGAAVDVYRDDSPLLGLENAVCLPHVGAYTFESVENMGIVSAENCVSVLQGREPQFRVTKGG